MHTFHVFDMRSVWIIVISGYREGYIGVSTMGAGGGGGHLI